MNPKYRYSESTVEPSAIEVTSDNTVYLRKDIVSEARTSEQGGKIVYWTYKEAVLTSEEFSRYTEYLMSLNAVKDIDNAKNIRHLVTKQENGDVNQIVIMEALAEIYETIATIS